MESVHNSKDNMLKEEKSDNISKIAANKTMNNLSENQLSNDLKFRRDSLIEDDQSSINYENLYLNTESNLVPSTANLNENINTNENLNFEENSSQNIYYNNTEENLNNVNTENNQILQNINTNDSNNVNNHDQIEHKLCYICEASNIEYYFICGNGCCIECLVGHICSILEKYKQKVFSEKIKFVCVGSCKCIIDNETFIKIINENINLHNLHNDVLFKMHIAQSEDIISCPKSSCSNAGFIQENCDSPCLECNNCGTKISNPKEFNFEALFDYLEYIKFTNIKSHILKIFTTKYCNKCKSPIEKADGCKHIECNRCEYSFCWKCTGDWNTHSQSACMGVFSNPFDDNDKPDFFFIICFYLTVLLMFKFISSFYILFKLYYFFMALLFGAGIIINMLTTAGLIDLLMKYKIQTVLLPFFLFLILEGIFYYFEIHPLSEKAYLYAQVICNSLVGFIMTLINYKRRR